MHHTQHIQHIQPSQPSQPFHRSRRIRLIAAIAVTVPLLGSTVTAQARQDPGAAVFSQTSQSSHTPVGCTLKRVDTQFVTCDNLTGNNVPAPAWISQR